MSSGVFHLDEDRERESSRSPSPSPSPRRPSPPHHQPPPSASARATGASSPALQVPTPVLPQSQPFGRKTAAFAATPSFSSPLAQAVTVASHTDSSSSSSGSSTECSPHASDDEGGFPRGAVPAMDGLPPTALGRPVCTAETTYSASPRRSYSRPPSPSNPRQAATPGSLLMNRVRRSGSVSLSPSTAMSAPPSTRGSPPIPLGNQRQDASASGSRRSDFWSDVSSQRSHHSSLSGSSGRGTASETGGGGSSPLAFGSPELEPAVDSLAVPPPMSVVSPTPSRSRDGNILGLGWASGWSGSTAASSTSNSKGKGKSKESSRPSSPKKETSEVAAPIPSSPVTRPRRGSEYMRSSSVDLRKQQPLRLGYGPNGGSGSLSSSASLISPLDPLPSPWSETPGALSGGAMEHGPGSSLSRSVTGASIRLNRVPTSVRLAADLIKTTSTPPPHHQQSESTTSVPTPNPSPAEADKSISGLPTRKVALPASASLPPGAFNAALSASPPAPHRHTLTEAATDSSSFSSLSSPTSAAARTGNQSPGVMSPASPAQVSQSSRGSATDAIPSRRSSPVAVLSPSSAAGSFSVADDASRGGVDSSPTKHLEGVGPSRLRAASEKGGLTMDLAGVSAIGDAASHANLIMQSRHAKVQRWRPRGVGSPESEVPPLLTPGGSPANRLSASYVEGTGSHFSNWDPTRDWRMGSNEARRFSPAGQRKTVPQPPASHLGVDSAQSALGSVRMEKQVSATGSVASIEWVDWYDEYKAYKAEKIRAEAQAASERQESQPVSPLMGSSLLGEPEYSRAHSSSTATLTATPEQAAMLHRPPKDDSLQPHDSGVLRRRSLSLRSAISAIDQKMSPNPKRSGFLDRPRQSSGGSQRSGSGDTYLSLRRKKNLVSKMEGWWNAVKSNFSPDEGDTRSFNPAPLYSHPRVPSAPQSRRGSDKSSSTFLGSGLHPPEPVRRSSSHSMRSVRPSTSHMDLPRGEGRSGNEFSHRKQVSSVEPAVSITPLAQPAPAVVHKAGEIKQIERHAVGLEVRRNQPSLRLELEPTHLTMPGSQQRDGTRAANSTDSRSGAAIPGSMAPSQHANSRSSSYGFGSSLTASSQWDRTPSPLLPALGTREAKDDKPVAPGADLTVASVRRHVKQRLNAAKEQCDSTLKRIIGTITIYVDQRMAATDDVEDTRQDYFDTFADSPSLDPADSEDDWTIPPLVGNAPSRSSSRRGSMSLSSSAITSSPSRRMNALSSVPSSPRKSMSRRRPSIVPRREHRGLSADQPSACSSRSTSRSRSPMPHVRGSSHAHQGFDVALDADRLFLTSLQELIVLATDVLDLTVDSLISRPSACVEVVREIQKTGQSWDEHEDWPGRAWYVDILMAVARLARVLEWWEAEKGFWNFDEDPDEPLSLLLRPTKDIPQFELEPGRPPLEASQILSSPSVDAEQDLSQSVTTITLPRSQVCESPAVAAVDSKESHHLDDAAQAIEDLRILAQEAQNVNIVMELSLQGEEIIYVNDAIYEVIGRDPEDLFDKPISDLLAPADTSHFSEATEQLLEDDSNTVQLRFRLEAHMVEGSPDEREPGPNYMELEGVGMLIRENNEPSHTMWVMKPVTATQVENITDAVFPRDGVISMESVLCRICEREIVVWFFEKHNETCDAVHRLDAEIDQANDCLCELLSTVNKLKADLALCDPQPISQMRPIVFYQIPDSISNSNAQPDSLQGVDGTKVDLTQLQSVISILTIAKTIESPSVMDSEADLPFNLQRYISAESEEKLLRITRWQKPATSDSGLARLFSLIEDQLRQKQKAIARMQSTIRYSEKTRHEWEDKINQMITDSEDASGSDSGSDEPGASIGSAETPAMTPLESSGLRAPAVRLPITQGHPQRSAHDSSIPRDTRVQTGHAVRCAGGGGLPEPDSCAVTSADEGASSAPEEPSTPQRTSPLLRRNVTPRSPESSRSRPLERSEQRGHTRRVSSVKAIRDGPVSPFLPTSGSTIATKAPAPSIKDFEIIKPISRGAFGSVYLAKKVATGDYYAIKALKKSDMIAKNQITNVKAERTILMNQASSPYVVKLYFSFQSKEYLYLVMEYLNGGDCATLVKTLGALPIDWARNYIGELVLGLEYLHGRNVAHRDIKPDNMLIDSHGHLKLTDFGLSKMGLLNRQIGGPRPPYLRGTSLRTVVTTRSSMSSTDSPLLSPETVPVPSTSQSGVSYFPQLADSPSADDSSGSESNGPIPKHMRHRSTAKSSSDAGTNSGAEPPRFVGTPDYLAPESILGGSTDDRMVDWWAVGVVLYEFLYGFPPFHADSPEKVFDNVVSRRINWHEDEIDVPPDARDLMDRLMCSNASQRLGARGADEVKRHGFFSGIDFSTLTSTEAVFVPNAADPESTDYFDPRGANSLADQEDESVTAPSGTPPASEHLEPTVTADPALASDLPEESDDFGTFNFKNLPVLKQANDDVIRRIRSDSIAALGHPIDTGVRDRLRGHHVHRKASSRARGPPSPSTSTSSAASTPSRAGASPVTPSSIGASLHLRRPSELNALERVKLMDHDSLRQHPGNRFRAGSGSSASDRSSNVEAWAHSRRPTVAAEGQLVPAASTSHPAGKSLVVLVAEDNPISQMILETLLTRLGCRCVCVQDGPEALAAAMGSIKFDIIFCDMNMPFVNGEQVARMLRSTTNTNQNTPIIAATAYDETISEQGTVFSAILPKPFSKVELLQCLAKVGFSLSCTPEASSTPM